MKLRKMPLYETDADGHKAKRLSLKWYAVFCDYSEALRRLPLLPSRSDSAELARTVDRLNSLRSSGDVLPPDMARAVETLPPGIRSKLARWGILSAAKAAAGKPLAEHLADWKAALLAKGGTQAYADLSAGRVLRIIDGCRLVTPSDVSASKVQSFLAGLRRETRHGDGQSRPGMSAATFNYYLRDARGFLRWMVRDGRAMENPLAHLQGINARTDRRHDRRALSPLELRWLLDVTAKAPERFGMSGADRAMLYRLAVETGLRSAELRSLTRSSFNLEGDEPTVTIAAAYAKNRRQDTLPLRPNMATLLAAHLAGKMPTAAAFAMPKGYNVAEMFRADLADGRTAWIADAAQQQERTEREGGTFLSYRDDASRCADFHSLRHSFISNLAAGGVHPKTAQTLARHSTIGLTMDRYTHLRREDLAGALDTLPDLLAPDHQAATATGTDGKRLSPVGANRQVAALVDGNPLTSLSPGLSLNGANRRNSAKAGEAKTDEIGSCATLGETTGSRSFAERKLYIAPLAESADATDLKSVGP